MADSPEPDDELAARAASSAVGTETVLLVEDEASVRVLITRVLQRAGYRVLVARNGAEALVRAEQLSTRLDLLLADVVMPEMSGREVAALLHARQPDLEVIFMSGYTDDHVLRHGITQDTFRFLPKPIDPGELLALVRETLDSRGQTPDHARH
jgi:two-component system, cell cycle sensor histidine kinase and response regulator CckA